MTERQQEASRINGAKSQGPTSQQGKQKSAANSRQHGLTAKMLRLTEEQTPAWESLFNFLCYEHKPFGETEYALVEDMAYATWQVKLIRESIGKYDIDTSNPEERKRLELLHRYLRQHTRNLEAEISKDLVIGMPALIDYAKVAKQTRAAEKVNSTSDIAAYVAKASDLTPEEKAILERMR